MLTSFEYKQTNCMWQSTGGQHAMTANRNETQSVNKTVIKTIWANKYDKS